MVMNGRSNSSQCNWSLCLAFLCFHFSEELLQNFTQVRCTYAWFNSTCYHPPRAHPRGFAIEFSLGGLFPTLGHAERDNSPPLGLLIDHKYVVLCTKQR